MGTTSNLKRRLGKLENLGARGKAIIPYSYDKNAGPGAKALAMTEATELWEEENGPLGNAEPEFFLWSDCQPWVKPKPMKPGSIRLCAM